MSDWRIFSAHPLDIAPHFRLHCFRVNTALSFLGRRMASNTPSVDAVQHTKRSARLAATLRDVVIGEGKVGPDGMLPSYRELCRTYKVGLRTVARAIQALEEEGVVWRSPGRGVFVRAHALGPRESNGASALRVATVILPAGWPQTAAGFLYEDYLSGYTDALDCSDVRLRFASPPPSPDRCEGVFLPNVPLEEQGCVIVNEAPAAMMAWLENHRVPFVIQFSRCYDDTGLPPHRRVFINKVGGGFRATQYLLSLGHRRIGLIGGMPGNKKTAFLLPEGYRAALLASGLNWYRKDVLDLQTDVADRAVAPVKEFLANGRKFTALYAETDAEAVAALKAARTLGIRVPEDLTVVGSNDQPFAAEADPPLTTLALPRRRLGRTAMEMLVEAAAGRLPAPAQRILEPEMVGRKSAAPPK